MEICSLVTLAKMRGFANPTGNFGHINLKENPSDNAAKMRYPHVRTNDEICNLFKDFLNPKFIPYHNPDELDNDQPIFLPSPIPIGLIGEDIREGIAINKSVTCMYSKKDLFKRLKYLIHINKIFNYVGFDENDNYIISPKIRKSEVFEDAPNESFNDILTKGFGTIIIKPNYVVDKKSIILTGKPSKPYSIRGNTGISALLKLSDKYNYRILDQSKREGDKFRVKIIPNRKKDFNENFIKLIDEIVTVKVKIYFNVINNHECAESYSPDKIILNSYKFWCMAYKRKLLHDIDVINDKIKNTYIMNIAREVYNENSYIKSINELINCFINDDKYKKYHQKTNKDEFSNVCKTVSFKRLVENKSDMNKLISEKKNIEEKVQNIEYECYNKMLNMYESC